MQGAANRRHTQCRHQCLPNRPAVAVKLFCQMRQCKVLQGDRWDRIQCCHQCLREKPAIVGRCSNFSQTQQCKMQANMITHRAAISASKQGHHWAKAPELFSKCKSAKCNQGHHLQCCLQCLRADSRCRQTRSHRVRPSAPANRASNSGPSI